MSMQSSTAAVEAILHHNMNNRDTLWLALQAAGSGVGGPDGNKMLAMVGDAAMKLVLLEDMYPNATSRGNSTRFYSRFRADNLKAS